MPSSYYMALSQTLLEYPEAKCSCENYEIFNTVSHLCLQVFQPEDEKELEEKFSGKHRKTILQPQKRKESRNYL